jgi:hypothetical protein
MGKAKQILDAIISQRGGENPIVAKSITTRLVLKGINMKSITESSPDDPNVIQKLRNAAQEMGVIVK